ncbi:MAG: hypothetical protein ACKOSQ_09750 [Planctomycetaceae bacterium]
MSKKTLVRVVAAAMCVAVMSMGLNADAGWRGSHGSSGGSWGSHGGSWGSSGGSWGRRHHHGSWGSSGGSY